MLKKVLRTFISSLLITQIFGISAVYSEEECSYRKILEAAESAFKYDGGVVHEATKVVTDEWTWISDYVFVLSDWIIVAEGAVELELGTGIKTFGEPRGSREVFRTAQEFQTWGAGAIHVRTKQKGAVSRVQLFRGSSTLIPIVPQTCY